MAPPPPLCNGNTGQRLRTRVLMVQCHHRAWRCAPHLLHRSTQRCLVVIFSITWSFLPQTCIVLEAVLLKFHTKLGAHSNFDPIQEIEPKVGGGHSFVRLKYMCCLFVTCLLCTCMRCCLSNTCTSMCQPQFLDPHTTVCISDYGLCRCLVSAHNVALLQCFEWYLLHAAQGEQTNLKCAAKNHTPLAWNNRFPTWSS